MPPTKTSKFGWDAIKKWIVGLTGVLVVMPALINAGIDIYQAVLKIPRTEAEKANVELFRKYFNKHPVASFPVPIKQGSGVFEARFSVYEEGDVYVEYGAFTQWFPFPKSTKPLMGFGIMDVTEAMAQESVRTFGSYQQHETRQGQYILRQRIYSNGSVEKQTIDPRTGRIVEQSVTPPKTAQVPQDQNQISPYGGVDLNSPKPPAQTHPRAKVCVTSAGNCAVVQAIPSGSPCFCVTPNGPVDGFAN